MHSDAGLRPEACQALLEGGNGGGPEYVADHRTADCRGGG